jgi:glycosyltransferase involved in cell wall biosynthesis
MRVVNIFYYYDERITSEEEVIQHYQTTTGWAEALQQQGVESIILTRFHKNSIVQKNNIQYHFIKDGLKKGAFRTWQLPVKFLRSIKELEADIIHVHSLTLSLQTFLLRLLLHRKTGIIVQHHGGKLPGSKKRRFHNFFNRVADGFFFSTAAQGQEWFMKATPFFKIMPVMEGATFFNYNDRDARRNLTYHNRQAARQKTGMSGAPVFLWVGRLDENKDPLTVLAGFEILFKRYPEARLYMVYSDDQLLEAVTEKINSGDLLQQKVCLLGKITHEEIEYYYNSADYFVLGSHYEGSGYALSEALRCGCVPVITNIPSFTMMTNGGRLGALWQPGNSVSLAEAAAAAMTKSLQQEANACIDFFRSHLSFEAIARMAQVHYQQVKERRSGKNH